MGVVVDLVMYTSGSRSEGPRQSPPHIVPTIIVPVTPSLFRLVGLRLFFFWVWLCDFSMVLVKCSNELCPHYVLVH